MYSVLIACKDPVQAAVIKKVVREVYSPYVIRSFDDLKEELDLCDLVLVDHKFTERDGIDFLTYVVTKTYLPVLMLTPAENARVAAEAMQAGARNYIIKTENYLQILNLSIQDAIDQVNERDEMKKTILFLKKRVAELEKALADVGGATGGRGPSEPAAMQEDIFQEIISRLKTGEVNLPSMPQISVMFRSLVSKGATIDRVVDLLKQDPAISSKLIAVSNTTYYRGLKPFVTLKQAISRLGMGTTRKFVEVISNRSLYTVRINRYNRLLSAIWEHSLASAYAAQVTSEVRALKMAGDPFTLALLHDIGKLILLQVIGEMEFKGILKHNLDHDKMRGLIRMYHADFGAVLLKKWKFPGEYFNVARYHCDMSKADFISPELLVVNFANLLVKEMGYTEMAEAKAAPAAEATSANLLQIEPEMLEDIQHQVKNLMKETSGIFM